MANFFIWIHFLFIVLHTIVANVYSQNTCKKAGLGKHFIIAFPENAQDFQTNLQLHVMIVSFQDIITEVNIGSPHRLSNNSYYARTVNVQPMSYERVIVPKEFELIGTLRSNKAIEIIADFEISVHVLHLETGTSDGYFVFPTDSLGTQYVVASYESVSSLPELFTIIGSQNYTNVSIQLNSSITFESKTYTRGDILELGISRLEAIQITSTGDLTGSIISSDNPIGLISGDSCANTPGSACDVLLEQSIPVSNWGRRHFYSATGIQTGSSKYRMIAFYNDTSFTVNNNNITLDSGEFNEFDLTGNGVIITTKPASLIQILTQIDGSTVDPSLIQVPTENQFTLMLGFTTPTHSYGNANGFNNFVNIIMKTDQRYSLRLNGSQITNTNTSLLPYVVHEGNILGSDYDLIVVRLPREENVYFITQELTDYSPMSAIAYGYENSESYGYVAGLSLQAAPSAPSLQSSINSFNASTCSADIALTWMTPPSNRDVDRYFLYLYGSPLATTNSTNYNHSTILNINTDYQYSLTASSCAGNSNISSPASINITSYSFSMDTHLSTCLVYNNDTGGLTIDWNLTQPTQASGVSGLELTYSLLLLYFHSRQGVTYTYTNSTSFSLPSSLLSYNTVLTAHNFTQLDAVETNIAVSLIIVQQCGQSYSGPKLNCSFRSDVVPTITSPNMNITKTIIGADENIESIDCVATGNPTPDIYWTRDFTKRFVDSSTLQITFADLSTDGEKVFYCVAENELGRAVVSVIYKLNLTTEDVEETISNVKKELESEESISDEKSGQSADITKVVIDSANGNDAIKDEEKNQILENATTVVGLIVDKTNGTFSDETSEKITELLSSIAEGSLEIEQPKTEPEVQQQGTQSTVATISSALAATLNTLERFLQRLSAELANSEVNTVRTVESKLITIVVQNVALDKIDDNSGGTKAEIVLPKKSSEDVQYSVMIELSRDLALNLSTNGVSLAIATSIVKRIESKESDSSGSTQGSDILTIAIAGKSGTVELTEQATLSFDVYSSKPSESTCVFLNGTSWVSTGLNTDQQTDNLTLCNSTHFTSFAVFVTPHKTNRGYTESVALSVISYLLVGISFVSLLISLILFIVAGKPFFKVEANIVYFNYCLSMLLATGLFIFGIQVGTYNVRLCKIIAFLLHYSWLAVFTWTLCIGILIMYKIVISVLSTRKIYWYLIVFGWVFPIKIPIITILVTIYGTNYNYVDSNSHCFLNVAGGIIWAFIGPILSIIVINALFLFISLFRIIQTKLKSQNDEMRAIIKNALITGLVLTPVLGLPWLFLLFNITIQHSILEWIFIFINGLMGLIFLFVVVLRNREVLALFKRRKQTTTSNTNQNLSSSAIGSTFTSNRFKKPNTLERQTAKESEIKAATIEPYELYKSSRTNADNIYEDPEDKNVYETVKHIKSEAFTGYEDPVYSLSDDPPVYQSVADAEMVTEVHHNPLYEPNPF